MHRKLSASKQITLGAMVTALTLLCLYAAAALPVGNIAFYFLSSVFIYSLTCERAYAVAAVSFAASSALAFFILPNRIAVLYYVALLGHYGLAHTLVYSHVNGKVLRSLIMLLYCDVFAGLGLYLIQQVFHQPVPFTLPDWLPVWAIVALAQLAFILFDFLYCVCIQIYESRIRRTITSRR